MLVRRGPPSGPPGPQFERGGGGGGGGGAFGARAGGGGGGGAARQRPRRDASSCLPCSAPLRLSACALRNSSVSSLSPPRSASWMWVSRRRALLRQVSVYQMRL